MTSKVILKRANRDYGIPPECVYLNVLGQHVNICHPNTATGYYPASNEAVTAMDQSDTNLCPSGMRPGRLVIKGLPATENTPAGYINTCGGRIMQEDMPDINVINWEYRIYLNIALLALTVIMLLAIIYRLFK